MALINLRDTHVVQILHIGFAKLHVIVRPAKKTALEFLGAEPSFNLSKYLALDGWFFDADVTLYAHGRPYTSSIQYQQHSQMVDCWTICAGGWFRERALAVIADAHLSANERIALLAAVDAHCAQYVERAA